MWKGVILVAFSFVAFSQQFDINRFESHCQLETDFHLDTNFSSVRLAKAYVCSNIVLTVEDQIDIQHHKYDISLEKAIVLKGGNLGYVNRNFFNLFSQSNEIYFVNTTMKVNSSDKLVNSHMHPLKSIWIESSIIEGNENANLFDSLRSLERIRMVNNSMEYKILNRQFFKHLDSDVQVKEVEVIDCDFENIESSTFDSLVDLRALFIVNNKIDVPKKFLKRNQNLKNVNINGRKLSFWITINCICVDFSNAFCK